VRLGRVELPTLCFGGTRSIQLSYSRAGMKQLILPCFPRGGKEIALRNRVHPQRFSIKSLDWRRWYNPVPHTS
jgi:hypothetical protein